MMKISHISNRKNIYIISSLVIALVFIILFLLFRDNSRVISLEQLKILEQKRLIEKMVVDEPYLYIRTKKGSRYKIAISVVPLQKVAKRYPIEYHTKSLVGYIVTFLLIFAVLFLFYIFTIKNRQNISTQVIENHKKDDVIDEDIRATKTNIKFANIAGLKEPKAELQEIIDFLHNPKKYISVGAYLPKGVLLAGPPGVGKTLLAKAVAGEAGVPFFYQSGASFADIYVGMGAKRVRKLFQQAKKAAPSIIFIDEIDAVGKSRGGNRNDEREATLNQLLTEMDGFESDSGVVVIGATNRIEMLDDALLRSGRFDRRVHISLPDRSDRLSILELYMRDKKHNVNLDKLAGATVGFSSASLQTLVNEASLNMLRAGRKELFDEDFEEVIEKVLIGKHQIVTLSDEEREIQAVYQGGKVLAATWFDVGYEKIGLVTTLLKESESAILTRNDILNRIKFYLSGSSATKFVYKDHFSNASSDLQKATELARDAVYKYKMGAGIIPTEQDVEDILIKAEEESIDLMQKLNSARIKITQYLLVHENISQDDAREILREIF